MADDDGREYIVIRFPKPRFSERYLWAFIVLVLIGLVLWNPFNFGTSAGGDVSAAASSPDKELKHQVITKPAPEVIPAPEATPEPVSKPTQKALSGELTFDILGITQEKKSTGSVKVKNVKYEISNQKKDYNFGIKVKAYAQGDTATSQQIIRGQYDNLPLSAGKEFSSVVVLKSGTWLSGTTINVIVIVEDFDTGEELLQKKATYVLS